MFFLVASNYMLHIDLVPSVRGSSDPIPINVNQTLTHLSTNGSLNFTFTLIHRMEIKVMMEPSNGSDYDLYFLGCSPMAGMNGIHGSEECVKPNLSPGTYMFSVGLHAGIGTFNISLSGWLSFPVHNQNTGLSYDTIQGAIDAPETLPGHNILVGKGIYYEYLVVNKSVSLIGEDRFSTLIDGNNTGIVVTVKADNVSIRNFTIQKSGCCGGSGVRVEAFHENVNITDNIVMRNAGYGIKVDLGSQIIVDSNEIASNGWDGIYLLYSSNCTVSVNTLRSNTGGLTLSLSNNNTIFGNMVTNNTVGIAFSSSSQNMVFHNNFIENTNFQIYGINSTNTLNSNLEGNYWSSYSVIDQDHNGIGDIPYIIDASHTDHHPLAGMFSDLNTSLGKHVNIISNSTIKEATYYNINNTIRIKVSNMTVGQTFGFCRISIPHQLMDISNISVIIDNGSTDVLHFNEEIYDNGTHKWIYFAYEHSTHEINIIPEFTTPIIFVLFVLVTSLATLAHRREMKLVI
jgi:parallel beta-helix repeat protein